MLKLVKFENTLCRTQYAILHTSKACKSKLVAKKPHTEFALEHFDNFYPKVFGAHDWRSARLALLSMRKYCAILNPYAITEEVLEKLDRIGAIEMKELHETKSRMKDSPLQVQKVATPEIIEMEAKEELPVFDESSRLIKEGQSEAMLQYVPASEMVYQEDVLNDDIYYEFLKPEAELLRKHGSSLPMPELRVFTFPRGVVRLFPPPKKPIDNLYEYYLMDAASLLPVIALNVKEDEDFADFCAAPGGKSLAVAFSRRSGSHFCTDISPGRTRRLRLMFSNYLPQEIRNIISTKHADIIEYKSGDEYDKILVDVPCTNDRHSMTVDENNIFHPKDIQARLNLPQKQTDILKASLQQLRLGGAAVYSTCSLSPIQNDSVVHMAIQSFREKKFVVTSLEETFESLNKYFKFSKVTRYGTLVVPYLPNNFGPMFICRIERII